MNIMDKFLEKIKLDLENKILTCVTGESIIKPFGQVYEEVRVKAKKNGIKKIYTSEESIYYEVINEYLKEHPEFINKE